MMTLTDMVNPVGWALVHFLWQGLLIGLLHEIAIRAAHCRSPQLRYFISLAALVAVMLAPLATLVMHWPSESVSMPVLASGLPAAASQDASSLAAKHALTTETWLPWIVAAWLAGVLAMSLRFAAGLFALNRLAANADANAISGWMRDELAHLCTLMGIRRDVRIALSARVGSPLVIGWLRPVILLPLTAATGLDQQQIRMVLAHELAHLCRHDHLVNLLQVVVETLLFYHPAVHRISTSLRQEREQCCDDMAAEVGGNALAYARVLAELEEMRQRERQHVLALGIAEQELYARIQRLVGGTPAPGAKQHWLPLLLIGLLSLALLRPLPDASAPFLPDWDSGTSSGQRVELALPPPQISREYKPIEAPRTKEAIETVASRVGARVGTPGPEVPVKSEPSAKLAVPTASETVAAMNEPERVTANKAKQEEEPVPARMEPIEHEPVIAGGELLHAEEPFYPRQALRRAREGEVLLEFTVTETGRVTDVEVLDATPRGLFESAAESAIRHWRFEPFTEDGQAVARRATQVIEFRLAEPTRRGGTAADAECREQTGTRLCRAEHADTTLRILN